MEEFITEWPPSENSLDRPTTEDRIDTPDVEPQTTLVNPSPSHHTLHRSSGADWPRAQTVLARWYRSRSRGKSLALARRIPHNPRLALHQLKADPAARDFLRTQLQACLSTGAGQTDPDYHYALATFYQALGQLESALDALGRCIACGGWNPQTAESIHIPAYLDLVGQLSETEREYYWLRARVGRELALTARAQASPVLPRAQAVPRVPVDQLSVEDFRRLYARGQQPVILTGGLAESVNDPWTLEWIKTMAGSKSAVLKTFDPDSLEWARLESIETVTVAEFIDSILTKEPSAIASDRYLFDWSLPLHCPELADKLCIPKYFQHDLLKQTSVEALYHQSWPSLFVASEGVQGGLHVDAFGSHFWMILLQGHKKWTFFPREATPHLMPVFEDSLDPVFDADLSDQSLLASLNAVEIVLQPGEILFVPQGCPHQVGNLTATVAVSGNFVDDSNYDEVVKHLKINGLVDPRAVDLLRELASLPKTLSDLLELVFSESDVGTVVQVVEEAISKLQSDIETKENRCDKWMNKIYYGELPGELIPNDALEGGPKDGVLVSNLKVAGHEEIHIVHMGIELFELPHMPGIDHILKVLKALGLTSTHVADLSVGVVTGQTVVASSLDVEADQIEAAHVLARFKEMVLDVRREAVVPQFTLLRGETSDEVVNHTSGLLHVIGLEEHLSHVHPVSGTPLLLKTPWTQGEKHSRT
eukprot:maker-scaffold776_size99073-snap-gene-0.20 protein:Tk00564 transcript:maker-scaffold776_size99073-snap-gene-0.20-mRNA-1 annotation:"hypothetical protein BRAFLDRAFT_84996"